MAKPDVVTGPALKQALWETLLELRKNGIDAAVANSIATQAREITRASRVQLEIIRQAKIDVPTELIQFATPAAK